MRMPVDEARVRLAARVHGVLATMHPRRGPDPQPVVYTLHGEYVGLPIDRVKPKASSRLQREDNLAADPRATLLIEHWDADDWSQLWWVRAQLEHEPEPSAVVVEDLTKRLTARVPQYADRPFHRVLVCRLVAVTGWAAGVDQHS